MFLMRGKANRGRDGNKRQVGPQLCLWGVISVSPVLKILSNCFVNKENYNLGGWLFKFFQSVLLLSYNLCNTIIACGRLWMIINQREKERERKKAFHLDAWEWWRSFLPQCLIFKIRETIKFTQLKRMKINFQL